MGYVYIAAAIACWTGLAFAYRWADRSGASRLLMSPVIGCVVIAWVGLFLLVRGIDVTEAHASQFIIGGVIGVVFAVLIPIFLAALGRGDLSITWMVLQLSFALTSTTILIYPGETPTAAGVTGLIFAAGAIALLGYDMRVRHRTNHPRRPKHGWGFFMTLAYVMNSATQYGFKLATHFRPDTRVVHDLAYMLSLYTAVVAMGTVLALSLARRGSAARACMTGPAVGTCLFLGGLCVLQALSAGGVPGHVLFPATAGGGTILVVLLSVVFLKEQPGRFGWVGLLLGTTALMLLGLAA